MRFKYPATRRRGVAWVCAAALGAVSTPQVVAQDRTGAPLTLEQARSQARLVAPSVAAARHAVAVAAGLERQAGGFPNPTLSYAREQTSGNGGTNWQNIVLFTQPLEIGGRRGALQDASAHRHAAARAQLEAVHAQIDFEVSRAYALAVAAAYRAARTAEAAEVFAQARVISGQRLALGDISGYENRRVALEAARYAALNLEVMARSDGARLSLAALLSPSADSVSAMAAQLQLVAPGPPRPIEATLDSLLLWALARRPDLQVAEFARLASVADARAASRRAFPTPTVALGFKNERSATDMAASSGFALEVAVPIPLWDRSGGATAAATAETYRIEAEADVLRRDVTREVEYAWTTLTALREQLDGIRPLLGADAQIGLQAAQAAYDEGEIALVEWLDAVRAYQEAESSFANLQAEYAIRLATLERAVGSALVGGVEQ